MCACIRFLDPACFFWSPEFLNFSERRLRSSTEVPTNNSTNQFQNARQDINKSSIKNQFKIDMISLRYTKFSWIFQNVQFMQLFPIFRPHWKLFEWRFCIYAHWPSLTFDKRGWPSIINSRGCGITKAIIFGGRGSQLDCGNLFLRYKLEKRLRLVQGEGEGKLDKGSHKKWVEFRT